MTSVQVAAILVMVLFCLIVPALGTLFIRRYLTVDPERSSSLVFVASIACALTFLLLFFVGAFLSLYVQPILGCVFSPGPDCE